MRNRLSQLRGALPRRWREHRPLRLAVGAVVLMMPVVVVASTSANAGVNLVVNTTTYGLPNGQIVFNPATSTPTTVVNADGSWTTTVNPTFNNDIFFVGQAIPAFHL